MTPFVRTIAIAVVLIVSACAQSAAPAPATGDMALGPDNAKVTITEYAAPSCPVCKRFHDDVFLSFKEKYIDSGKVRFVLKEMPSHNPPVDVAVFLLGRCAGKDKYFAVIDAAFEQQTAIEAAARSPAGARGALIALAQTAGGLSESRATACINDTDGMQRIVNNADAEARANNISGTPTVLLNGEKMGPEIFDLAAFSAAIDASLKGK